MSSKEKGYNFVDTVKAMDDNVDFNSFKTQILEDIKAGKPLFGKNGALAPMLENIVNVALDAFSQFLDAICRIDIDILTLDGT